MGTTYGDRVAAAEAVVSWIREHKASLKGRGVDIEFLLTNLQQAIESTETANSIQEMTKAQLKRQTTTVNEWDRKTAVLTSSTIGIVMGAYGNNTPEAKQLQRLRSKLHRAAKPALSPA